MEQDEPFQLKAKHMKDRCKMSVTELAAACGVSKSSMSRYLSGEVDPPSSIADKAIAHLETATRATECFDDAKEEDAEMGALLDKVESLYLERIKELLEHLAYERRQKRAYFIVMLAAISFIIIVMLVDILNGNVGWFRH